MRQLVESFRFFSEISNVLSKKKNSLSFAVSAKYSFNTIIIF